MLTVLCLAPAIALNLFYSVQHLLETLARSIQSELCTAFAGWLHVCKTWGALVSSLVTLAAYLAISGVFSPNLH